VKTRPESATHLWCGACKDMHEKAAFGLCKKLSEWSELCVQDCGPSKKNKSSHLKAKIKNNQRHALLRKNRRSGPNSKVWAIKKLVEDAARRAKERGMNFCLTAEEIEAPDECPVFKCKLIYQATGKRSNDSASIDRIDSTKGYTPDNVWIISWRANQIKSDATIQELETLIEALKIKAAAGRLLRLWFHGCLVPAGDILLAIRNLRFIKNSATESNVNHGQRSISSALTSEVTGRNAIPESFFVEVPVFHNAFAYRESVEILVDIDDATETIRFVPAPGSIEAAIARAEERIGMHLQQEIASAMDVNYEKDADGVFVDDDGDPAIVPPVYYGKPE
jgi:hypothetical protein